MKRNKNGNMDKYTWNERFEIKKCNIEKKRINNGMTVS
jgi:hypothetical protein